jgi:hypothetical protein
VGCNCFLTRFSSVHVRRKGDGICQKVSAGFKVDAKRLPVLDSISGYIAESIFYVPVARNLENETATSVIPNLCLVAQDI